MVDDFDVQRHRDGRQRGGGADIEGTGANVSRRMVVRQDYAPRAERKGAFEQLAIGDGQGVRTTQRQGLIGDVASLAVKEYGVQVLYSALADPLLQAAKQGGVAAIQTSSRDLAVVVERVARPIDTRPIDTRPIDTQSIFTDLIFTRLIFTGLVVVELAQPAARSAQEVRQER